MDSLKPKSKIEVDYPRIFPEVDNRYIEACYSIIMPRNLG